jgi:hypothetical protein
MQSNAYPSYAEGTTTLPRVGHGELFRILQLRLVQPVAHNGTPPRARVRI